MKAILAAPVPSFVELIRRCSGASWRAIMACSHFPTEGHKLHVENGLEDWYGDERQREGE
jgi:hypothetical protein